MPNEKLTLEGILGGLILEEGEWFTDEEKTIQDTIAQIHLYLKQELKELVEIDEAKVRSITDEMCVSPAEVTEAIVNAKPIKVRGK